MYGLDTESCDEVRALDGVPYCSLNHACERQPL
jgi:hypothetical protein